jgi:hypothetical protein
MTTPKTKSLSLPSDPVARLREMHELDNPPPSPSALEALSHSSLEAPQHSSVSTLLPTNASTPERDNVTTQPPSSPPTPPRTNAAVSKRGSTEAKLRPQEPAAEENPVREAMRQALRKPYAAGLQKGPSTATTIRVPSELWERLDMAAKLQNQTKQDLIAEALKQYLMKIGRGEV